LFKDNNGSASLSEIVRQVRMLCAGYDSDACDARLIAAIATEVAALKPSRLRLAAACRRLRSSCLESPSIAIIVETIGAVDEQDIAQVAAIAAAWRGRGNHVSP
jgi:hypothetical protein